MKKKPRKPTSLGEQIIEREVRCPEGALTGEPIKLLPWQRDVIRKIYRQSARDGAVHHLGFSKIGKDHVRGLPAARPSLRSDVGPEFAALLYPPPPPFSPAVAPL